jgi:hypothetical protein
MNIFENLKKAVKKNDLQKLLDTLVEQKSLTQKIYGKFPIYWYNQD